MTKQRHDSIESSILIGLLDAPSSGSAPFRVDPTIFTTPLKRKIAKTINDCIDRGSPELALYNLTNAIDVQVKYQQEWLKIQTVGGLGMSVSMAWIYYRDLRGVMAENNGERI